MSLANRKCRAVLIAAVAIWALLSLPLSRATAQSSKSAQSSGPAGAEHVREAAQHDDAAAAAAFESIIPVLHHPRCMNCHSTGDYPRQGDDSHRHTMQIRRGPDGDGVNAVRCSTCHQDHNLVGLHTPPGAPDWHLPSPAMPMIWEGLTDRQLCELFKDPRQNGNRSVQQIVEHMATPLVLWGWTPGEGRTPVPMPQSRFLAAVKEWAAKGAACPAATSAPLSSGATQIK